MPSRWRQMLGRSERSTSAQRAPSPANLPPTVATQPSPTGLRARLWNSAYNELQADEPKIVEAYEKFLSLELPTAEDTEPQPRWHRMQRLVEVGLQKTAREAAVKEQVNSAIQTVNVVRGLVGKVVQASPEAAIAWVGVSFALEVLSNPLSEPGLNRSGLSYVVSRMEWYWNLAELLLDERVGSAFIGLQDQLETHIVRLYKKLLLYQMKSVCLYNRKRLAVLFRDLIILDDWGGQIDDIKQTEAAVWKDSEQYTSQQVRSHLTDIASAAERQFSELQSITSAIQDQTKRQEHIYQVKEDKQCLDDLYETDPFHDKTRIQDLKGGLLRDSYVWLLDNPTFKAWRTDPRGVFWIRGDPGKGKTMLLCGIIDEMEKQPAGLLAYFFCQATEQKMNTATAVVRGLIYTLVRQHPPLISYVRKEYDGGGKQRFEGPNAWEVMCKILTTMLDDPITSRAVLIVDALDECGAGRPQLLDLITRLAATDRARWIVSSRNWPEIEEKLATTAETVALRLELNEDAISDAVRVYIRQKSDQLARLKGYDEATRDAVHQHLTDKSTNTFLWVALVYQELAAPDVQAWEALDILHTLPSGLNSLYSRMMEHIGRSRHANLCRQILAIASVVYRPISLQELSSINESLVRFTDKLPDLEKLVRSCGSFLTVRHGVLYFVHQSAKDFLLDSASPQILPCGIEHQHRALFARSIEVMSQTLRRDIFSLIDPGISIDEISQPDPDPLAPARYSCMHWVDHLQDANPADKSTLEHIQDGGLVHTFLQHKYLYWLEAMSLQGSVSQAVMAIQKLQALVPVAGAQRLLELVQDARRFVLSHNGEIEMAPLQLYASALVFSPTKSLVRNHFNHDMPNWVTSLSPMQPDWDACEQTLEGHSGSVLSVAFSADGTRIASGSEDDTIKIWNRTTGMCVQTLQGHVGGVQSVVFLPGDARLVSGSKDCTIKIWDVVEGKCEQTLAGHSRPVSSVALSADGTWIASGSYDNTIKIWNTTTGTCVQTIQDDSNKIWSRYFIPLVAFVLGDTRLVSASRDHTIKIWDTVAGVCAQTLEGHGSAVSSVASTAAGRLLASGSGDQPIKIWDLASGTCVQTLKSHDNERVSSVAFAADSKRLASGHGGRCVRIWDVATGQCVQTLKGYHQWISSMAHSKDATLAASGSYDTTVKVWNIVRAAIARETCVPTLEEDHGTLEEDHSGAVWSLAFTADSTRLASGSGDHTIKIWDAALGKCLRTLDGHGGEVRSVAFTADGTQLVSGSDDKVVKIWDMATGACLHTLKGHSGNILAVACADTRIASGSNDNTIKIWDAVTGTCVQTLECHTAVYELAYVANGSQLASELEGCAVKIWDARTGTCIQTREENSNLFPIVNAQALHPPPSDANLKLEEAPPKLPYTHDCVISRDGPWILKGTRRLLWLPSEYRPKAIAVAGSLMALGGPSGKVTILQLGAFALKL
ncbi:WD40-repeat-containing domain protein [Emericellopsis atlantica]|uniref:WD40-repeat-containing domain protein n=1 Tax=Emericellopsis atlantica TaxID=2614577 RepID=A0A9P7ZWB8_9HYPO|nr:WD40-repeat-containing domain protein [Emericellopsis atlantica]KAG9258753.1 WD40-repeat-containing domain protein [Emericellopsis atlantica]